MSEFSSAPNSQTDSIFQYGNPTNNNQPDQASQMAASSASPTQAKPESHNLLKTIYTYFSLALIALLPLLVVPLTNNIISDSKLFLLVFATLLTTGLFFINSFKNRVWKLVMSPVTLPLTLFGLVSLASIFFTQNYPVSNLLSIGAAYISLWLIAVLGSSLIKKGQTDLLIKILAVTGAVLSVAGLLEMIGFGPTKLIGAILGITINNNFAFTLAGSALIATQVIALGLIAQISKVIHNKSLKTFDVVFIPLLLLGLGLHLFMMLPGKPAAVNFPPLGVSWSIGLDSVRVPKSALIGQGPSAYASTFSKYKPTILNARQNWRTNYGAAIGAPLTLMVQVGFLGLAAWVLLFSRFFNAVCKNKKEFLASPLTWMLLAIFVSQLLLPPNIVLLGLQAVLLAFWIAEFKDYFSVLKLSPLNAAIDKNPVKSSDTSKADKAVALIINGLVLAGVAMLFYFTGRTYAARYHLLKADKARADNQAVQVYDHQRVAKRLNPYSDQVRRAFAQTNLQIAIALSNKADITDEEKQQVGQLVQQAVTEARAATTINPNNLNNWLVLAGVYEQLIGSVEGADQWAVNAYVRAIQQAPADPLLRISLGNILLNNEQLAQAANLYTQAINLKPDLPTGYFYLGLAQQQGQNLAGAKTSWQRSLSLLDEGTQDYQQLNQLLEQLDQRIEEASKAAQARQTQQTTQQEQEPEQQTSPLSQELPSLTDQNLESGEQAVGAASDEELNLSEETEEVVNQEAGAQTENQEETQIPEPSPTQEEGAGEESAQ